MEAASLREKFCIHESGHGAGALLVGAKVGEIRVAWNPQDATIMEGCSTTEPKSKAQRAQIALAGYVAEELLLGHSNWEKNHSDWQRAAGYAQQGGWPVESAVTATRDLLTAHVELIRRFRDALRKTDYLSGGEAQQIYDSYMTEFGYPQPGPEPKAEKRERKRKERGEREEQTAPAPEMLPADVPPSVPSPPQPVRYAEKAADNGHLWIGIPAILFLLLVAAVAVMVAMQE